METNTSRLMGIDALSNVALGSSQARKSYLIDETIDGPTWLHIHVESTYYVLRQTSSAVAWTTSDKEGNNPKVVGEIFLTLACHMDGNKSERNGHRITLEEDMAGFPGIQKKCARATASTKGPNIGPLFAEACP